MQVILEIIDYSFQNDRNFLASSPEHLRVLVEARNVGLIVAGACCTECAAVVGS